MKENKIKGVMTELVESKDRKSAFEVFLGGEFDDFYLIEVGDVSRLLIRDILYNAKQEYKMILEKNENQILFKKMAEIETTIIQARCLLDTQVKLTMINQKRGGSETSYVVARAPFYNPDLVKAEIRVYLGKTEELGTDLANLSKDKKFMENAEKLIVKAMIEVMQKRGVVGVPKKSLAPKKMVTSEGDVETDYSQVTRGKTMEKKKNSPYSPGPGPNPKPKGGFPFLGGKINKEE